MLEVSRIKKKYGKKKVLDEVTFQAKCGESVAIVGKNGCGKTTLMQILSGILKADSGEIRCFGQNPQKKKKVFREFCGYVPQENPLMEELTVKDNLKLWGARSGKQYEELVRQFQLEEIMKTPVEKLSGGMKRRLSIACALVSWPPILLMDEPTTALDLYYKESIHNWMKDYQKRNGILVMATHDEQEIMQCDRCLIMKEGRVTELEKEQMNMNLMKQYIITN